MIKVGILGAHTAVAGELIRILINHPDVVLKTVASELTAGKTIASVHRGLIGDTDMVVAPTLPVSGHNAIFLCGEPWEAQQWMERNHAALSTGTPDDTDSEPVRVIDLTGAFRDGTYDMVYGLPEWNRKALVRGATRASIPSAIAMAVELALFPLAKNMLLQGNITIAATIAAIHEADVKPRRHDTDNVVMSTRLDPIAPMENRPDADAATREIATMLRQVQPNFSWAVNAQLSRDDTSARGITVGISLNSSLPVSELAHHFEEAYHDHNFTYLVDRAPSALDVENTNKCLIHLAYPSHDTDMLTAAKQLRITAVIDYLLKGSAGNAVHCMNLLFGLSERTGLSLKASAF